MLPVHSRQKHPELDIFRELHSAAPKPTAELINSITQKNPRVTHWTFSNQYEYLTHLTRIFHLEWQCSHTANSMKRSGVQFKTRQKFKLEGKQWKVLYYILWGIIATLRWLCTYIKYENPDGIFKVGNTVSETKYEFLSEYPGQFNVLKVKAVKLKK